MLQQNKMRAKLVSPRVLFPDDIDTIPHPIKGINQANRTKEQARQPFNRCDRFLAVYYISTC
jgi:hypothetical protein